MHFTFPYYFFNASLIFGAILFPKISMDFINKE